MKSTNLLLGLLVVAGAGGAYWMYTQKKREESGIEVATPTGSKWFFESSPGVLSSVDAAEIAGYCPTLNTQARARNVEVLTRYGYVQLAAACSSPIPLPTV